MKKITLILAILLTVSNLFSQQMTKESFLSTNEILVEKIKELSKSGYKIVAVMMKKEWGGIKLSVC